MGVAEVVEPDRWQSGACDELLERVGQQLGVGRCAVGSAEDVTARVVGVELGVFVDTPFPPCTEEGGGGGVEVDVAAGGA